MDNLNSREMCDFRKAQRGTYISQWKEYELRVGSKSFPFVSHPIHMREVAAHVLRLNGLSSSVQHEVVSV